MTIIEQSVPNKGAIIYLTPSKSVTNRLLIIRELCKKQFEIINKATAGDSVLLNIILNNIESRVDAKDAGTVFRFMTALLSIKKGEFILTGNERMQKRPIGSLVNALNSIGAEIYYVANANYPPLKIIGKELTGGEVIVDASESSQFVSAMLLIAPTLKNGLTIKLKENVSSWSYIMMTIELMRKFNVDVQINNNSIFVPHQEYKGNSITVENDWSAASFWYIICAMTNDSQFILKELKYNSIQGDAIIAEIMNRFGVRTEYVEEGIIITQNASSIISDNFTFDFTSHPDLVIPIAILCASLKINSKLTGVSNLRIKESDRLQSLKLELEKIGSTVVIENNSLSVIPGELKLNEIIDTHNDHRMAMAFAALSVKGKIKLNDGSVVSKSYPEFWSHLRQAGFIVSV